MAKSKYSIEEKTKAIKLYESGLTFVEVSHATSISIPYIKNIVHKAGVPTRKSGFQPGNLARTDRPHSEESKLLMKVKRGGKRDAVQQLVNIYEAGARSRQIEFSVSKEDFENIIFKDCFYCGSMPSLRAVNTNKLICNGVDRVNNEVGYTKDNLVTCCGTCNRMKSNMTQEVFIKYCKAIAERHK